MRHQSFNSLFTPSWDHWHITTVTLAQTFTVLSGAHLAKSSHPSLLFIQLTFAMPSSLAAYTRQGGYHSPAQTVTSLEVSLPAKLPLLTSPYCWSSSASILPTPHLFSAGSSDVLSLLGASIPRRYHLIPWLYIPSPLPTHREQLQPTLLPLPALYPVSPWPALNS